MITAANKQQFIREIIAQRWNTGMQHRPLPGQVHSFPATQITQLSIDLKVKKMTEQEYRIEHDTMGEVKVPKDALWRAQTQRAVQNFPISGRGLESTQIRAMGLLKAACAQVNKDNGALDGAKLTPSLPRPRRLLKANTTTNSQSTSSRLVPAPHRT